MSRLSFIPSFPRRLLYFAAFTLLSVGGVSPRRGHAQTLSPKSALLPSPAKAAEEPPAATLTVEDISTQRTALRKEIETTRTALSQQPESASDDTSVRLSLELTLLERLDRIYAEQLRTLQHAADLAKESAEIQTRTQSRRPPETTLKPPYGLEQLDHLYGDLAYLRQARDWLKTDVANATEALREARDTLTAKDRARRATREQLDRDKNDGKAQGALRLSELESRVAQETGQLREAALHTLKTQQGLLAPKEALVEPEFAWLRAHLEFTEAELAAEHTRREQRLALLKTALTEAKTMEAKVARAAAEAERRAEPGEALEFQRADRDVATRRLGVLTAQFERVAELATITEQRRAVLAGRAAGSDQRDWAAANRTALDALEKERTQDAREFVISRREWQELTTRLGKMSATEKRAAPWVEEHARQLGLWVEAGNAELGDVDALRTARLRLKDELGPVAGAFSPRDAWPRVQAAALAAWSYEVFSVQDQPVRVRTILAVMLLLALGHALAKRTSRTLGRRVFPRFGWTRGRSAAWQTLCFYALFLIVLLAAFNLFHLSLTQFSVVSGALAVAIGFGSQKLIGNFISGLILLIERPINEGDVIELDGQQVTVERLGPRSTIVRSAANTQVIVPNSLLLDRSVTNWTLSDDIVRLTIRVGVAYGSPTRDVDRVLTEVLGGHPDVRREPAPRVQFHDFGANALQFDAVGWCCVAVRGETESELRHRIAEAFAKAGIVLAFPQRDLHLNTVRPLQVEFAEPDREAAPEPPPPKA